MKKLTVLLLLVTSMVSAQIPDPQSGTYINDLAGVMHENDKKAINELLRHVETQFGVQMAIVLVDHLPANYEIEDYAREIGRKWHVGNAKNGIVYVASIQERKQRLEIANHLEGVIPDITAKHLTDMVKPYFRDGKYGGGLLVLVGGIVETLKPDQAEQQKLTADELSKKKQNAQDIILVIFLIVSGVAVSAGFAFLIYRRQRRKPESNSKDTITNAYGNSNYATPTFVNEAYSRSPYDRNYDDYTPPSRSYDSDSSSSSSSDYGNWGSGSSDSSSSFDSGFDGGGSSNDW